MTDERQLFSQFAADRSDQAFAAIVKLHLNLVFATALRQVGNRALAEEITQNVFLTLARKAGSLHGTQTLAGWLYQTTLNHSRHFLRTELRRRRKEELAAACALVSAEGQSTWAPLIPLLDEALGALREPERVAVILHYMEGRPYREVAVCLGVGEDAARKRVDRALAWLTNWFKKKGISLAPGTLVAALSLESTPPVSAALAGTITVACSSTFPAAAGGSVSTLGIIMASTKTKIALAGAALALLVTAPIFLRDRMASQVQPAPEQTSQPSDIAATRLQRAELRGSNSLSPDRSAPFPATSQNSAARQKSLLERVNEGDESLSMLPGDQAQTFVNRNRANAESLLAAYRVSHDLEYLRMAATNFPNDPAVLLRVVGHDAFPDEQRTWLDQYKRADSSNSLPYYLSAADHLKSGQFEKAYQDLAEGTQKKLFQDHVTANILALEEIYLAAGHSSADSKALAACAVELPHFPKINDLSRSMVDLVKQYRQAGDNASAQNLIAMGLQLSSAINQTQDGGNVLGQMVAVRTERSFLEQLDPAQTYSFIQGSVPDRIAASRTREQAIRSDAQLVNRWIPNATEPDIVNYFDRLKIQGESAAIEWLKNRDKAP